MKYLLKFLPLMVLALHLSSSTSLPFSLSSCTSACPRIFSPICAENDAHEFKYFHNDCLMNYESCSSQQAWKPTRITGCMQQAVETSPENQMCLRVCHFIYDPVCAQHDNGTHEIFANKCVFEMENCLANGLWKLRRSTQCGLDVE